MRRSVVNLRGTVALWTVVLLTGARSAYGGTVFDFLRTDVSSRAAGMAGSFVGVPDDPTVIFYNPAGLSTLSRPGASVGFFKHLVDINSGYAAYATGIENAGFVGASVLYSSYGSFPGRDASGNDLGDFSAGDLALTVSYSNLLEENLHYGISIKYIHSSIDRYTSSGVAGDFGLLFRIPDSRVTIAASVLNAGTQISQYGETKEQLPLDVVVGASVVPRGIPLLLHFSFHKLNADVNDIGDRFRAFRIGGEFTLSSAVWLRFGYDNEKRTDLKIGSSAGLAGFSGGLGFAISDYRLDYALTSWGAVGELHRFSLGAWF